MNTPPFTPNSRTTGWALFGLLAVAAAWGSSFPLTKALLDRMSALNFLAVRFSIAALLMIIVFFPALGMATVQLAVTALVGVLAALVVAGGVSMPSTGFDWAAIGYMAVVSGAVAMIVQSWAQAHLAPSRAAITMATEPAWAALFSILFLGEALTWRMAVGGGLMLAAMVIVESGH